MDTWKRIRSSLADEPRLAVAVAPAVIAAARAWKTVQHAREETVHVGRTSVTLRHDDRYRGYVLLALAGGAVLGDAASLLLAPRKGSEARSRLRTLVGRPWPKLDRIPVAFQAARTAAESAFHRVLTSDPIPPTRVAF